MHRLAWKQGLIGSIAERTQLDPVPLSVVEARAAEGGDPEYTRVTATGLLLNGRELHLYAFDEKYGPGWHILTPLQRADGSIVFVNRGYVPNELSNPAERQAGQLEGEVEIVGLVREPETPTTFTPTNDPAKNVWYWRDLDAMADAALGPDHANVAPFVIDAQTTSPSVPGDWPKGGTTRLELPNRHFEYALTWYGLAAALVGVFTVFAVSRWRGSDR
jgi:surfeit locus 1 family protein